MNKDKLIEILAMEIMRNEISVTEKGRKTLTMDDWDSIEQGAFKNGAHAVIKAINDVGFVIVPREPTEEIKRSYHQNVHSPVTNDTPKNAYKAMIEAGEIR